VLLYLQQDQVNTDRSAQVVLPALRLLSVGERLGLTNDGLPGRNVTDEVALQQRKAAARSVVLAVPEQLVSRLMLAAQSGTLRLAVRSGDDSSVHVDSASRELVKFTQLSMSGPVRVAPAAPGAKAVSAPRGPRPVEVIRGNQVTQQTP
jgi:pilus assembly protein CpaB